MAETKKKTTKTSTELVQRRPVYYKNDICATKSIAIAKKAQKEKIYVHEVHGERIKYTNQFGLQQQYHFK